MQQNSESFKSPDMMKELGKMWSSLSKSEKAIYEEFAKRDKLRYEREIEEFKKNGGNT